MSAFAARLPRHSAVRSGPSFILTCGPHMLLWSVALPALSAERGLAVRDGVLLKDGKPFRVFGINAVSLVDDILAKGEAASQSFRAIEYLGEKKIPFIRFWGSYFDNWKPYHEDPRRYWHNVDLLVAACEKAGMECMDRAVLLRRIPFGLDRRGQQDAPIRESIYEGIRSALSQAPLSLDLGVRQ